MAGTVETLDRSTTAPADPADVSLGDKARFPEADRRDRLSPKVTLRFMIFALASLCLFVLAGKEVIRILTLA